MKKQGISLIVLVITIIVLAILAAAVIISINNTGVIDSSQQTVLIDAYGNLSDILSMKYANLKVNANIKVGDTAPTGVIAEDDAVEAYTAAMADAGFTATTALTGIGSSKKGTYTKVNGVHTMTVTIELSADGVYTLNKQLTTATK